MTTPRADDWLNRAALRRAGGARSFARGEAYAAQGRVRALREQGAVIQGIVRGNADYRVSVGRLGAELAFSCTCPVGAEGSACKHVVATGLAWLDRDHPRPPGDAELRQHLRGRTKEDLVNLIMERAADDEWLYGRLVLEASATHGTGPDLGTMRVALDAAIELLEFIDYSGAYDYFRIVDSAIDEIEGLLATHPGAVIELAEHVLAALDLVQGLVDDSDGGLMTAVERVSDLHLAACAALRPDPEALAERLFSVELASELEIFSGSAETYSEILGPAGLARYRRLAEAEWSLLPALGPGEGGRWAGRRFRVTAMMEALARAVDDVEALVGVMAHDLSSAYSYLRIAETLQAAGRADEALAWAERGLRAFPERQDDRVSEFVAEAYMRAGRHDEALALSWENYTVRPGLERYQRLRERARAAGTDEAWCERARVHLRESIIEEAAGAAALTQRWGPRPDGSELVRILIFEGDVDAAWLRADEHGCSDRLWLQLAELRQADHPEDAIEVYRRGIEPAVAQKTNRGYEEAVALLRRMRPLLDRVGRDAEFARQVDEIRAAHRRKRNLIRLLDGLG